jgi:Ribbon-helix-helix protein, copG family
MKTAISIPDEIFEQAERAAKRLGLSRSELFTKAVKEFLDQRSATNITRSYDAGFGDGEEDDLTEFRRRASRQALLTVEWGDE